MHNAQRQHLEPGHDEQRARQRLLLHQVQRHHAELQQHHPEQQHIQKLLERRRLPAWCHQHTGELQRNYLRRDDDWPRPHRRHLGTDRRRPQDTEKQNLPD